jgi:hypothetical protein
VHLDSYARQACAKLDHAMARRNGGDPGGANVDEHAAVKAAKQSRSAGLGQLATGTDTLTLTRLHSWCYRNARS